MASNRHKTTIEIGVDDRQVQGLERSLGRAFDQRLLQDFERTLDRVAKTMEKMSGMSGPSGGGGGPKGGSGLGGGGTGTGGQESALVRELRSLREEMKKSNESDRKQTRSMGVGGAAMGAFGGLMGFHMMRRMMGGASGAATGAIGGSATSSAFNAIPVIGPAVSAAARQAVSLFGEHAQQRQMQAAAFGASGIGTSGMHDMVSSGVNAFGMAPGSVPAMVQQFAGMSGRTGGRLQGAMPGMMAMQQLLGIQGGGAGLLGAAESSGGNVEDPNQTLRDAVSGGIVSGFREGRMTQYFQQLGSFVEQARTRGIALDVASANSFFASVGSIGGAEGSFRGEAGAQFASSFGQGFSRGGGGQGSVWEALRLRAAGLGDGTTTYQQALEGAEDPRSGVRERYIEMVRSMAGDNPVVGAMMMRQATGAMGGDLGARQSREFFEDGLPIVPLMGEGEDLLRDRMAESGDVFSAGRTQGNLAMGRQSIGGRMAGTAATIQSADLQIMRAGLALLKPTLDALISALNGVPEALDRLGGAMSPEDEEGNALTPEERIERTGSVVLGGLTNAAVALVEATVDTSGGTFGGDVVNTLEYGSDALAEQQREATAYRTRRAAVAAQGVTNPGPAVGDAPGHLRAAADIIEQQQNTDLDANQ